jgi:2-polyprenyl-3-methyl-5-hydroxy-6-metoxy-1,4-benzoquinol methylase
MSALGQKPVTRAKSIVAHGYDVVARTYLQRFGRSAVRQRMLDEMMARLPAAARVLDLGCGAGVPLSSALVEHGFSVVGIDGSVKQIEMARWNVPKAEFVHADMTAVTFPPHSFDAVAAFYSITHVPREDHATLFERIAVWLKPGGLFIASLGAADCPGWLGEWLGAEMFFSHYDAATNESLVREAGFTIEHAEIIDQDNEDARFLWVIARRPPL